MFTPDPNLFNSAFGGGLRNGSALADLIKSRRDEAKQKSEFARLAQLAQEQDFTGLGSGLIGMGEVGQGVNALNVPYEREQASQLDLPKFTTPVQAFDAQGNPVFLQTNDRGEVKPIEGYRPANPLQKIDTGLEIRTIDSRTGQVVSSTPKENFQSNYDEAAGNASGKADVEAAQIADTSGAKASQILGVVAQLESHPGMEGAMGLIQGRLPAMSQQTEDFRALKDQLLGGTFLQAFESLRGGGAITQIEGEKASNAILAMRDTQSPTQFRKQLQIFRENVQLGMQKAKERGARLQKGLTPQTAVPVPRKSIADMTDAELEALANGN